MNSTASLFEIQHGAQSRTIILRGREAWALRCLITAGDRGCTPIDHPGPRWSAYVFDLRKLDVEIETIHEKHGPPYPGTHARYVLRSQARAIRDAEAA